MYYAFARTSFVISHFTYFLSEYLSQTGVWRKIDELSDLWRDGVWLTPLEAIRVLVHHGKALYKLARTSHLCETISVQMTRWACMGFVICETCTTLYRGQFSFLLCLLQIKMGKKIKMSCINQCMAWACPLILLQLRLQLKALFQSSLSHLWLFCRVFNLIRVIWSRSFNFCLAWVHLFQNVSDQ